MKSLLPLSLALGLSVAAAAPKITAQSIIVNPVKADAQVSVWTDRDPTGKKTPDYVTGDKIRLFVSVDQDAYVYLFSVEADGSIDQILPNAYNSGANFIKAGVVKSFPGTNDTFTYNVAGSLGITKVLAIASTTKLDLATLSAYKSNEKFAAVKVKGQQQLAQALSIVVSPVPQKTWSSDVAFINVVAKPDTQTAATPAATNTNTSTTTTTTTQTTTITLQPYTGATYARPVTVQNGAGYVFHSDTQVETLLKYYSGQLVNMGYAQDDQTITGTSAIAHFSGDMGKAVLNIKNTSGRVEVSVVRTN
ncbi:DUF4384 domain-containing protein [Deinococcus ruber]|uniref:DUF4384 domain-containing protein n=1 Tax=Deinococcus ruber TaxID=1848197 RepID=A0A918CD90_9DEIO|nr:DUF4384 domain-containing protein [Deinococcus ruber]GGR19329.1 hypothetical protein GCM10008957_34800 [Deinococcus ruber]